MLQQRLGYGLWRRFCQYGNETLWAKGYYQPESSLSDSPLTTSLQDNKHSSYKPSQIITVNEAVYLCEQYRPCQDYFEALLRAVSVAMSVEKDIATGKLTPSDAKSETILDITANILVAASGVVPGIGQVVGTVAQAANKAYGIKKFRDKRQFAAAVEKWTRICYCRKTYWSKRASKFRKIY